MKELKYSEILKKNRETLATLENGIYNIAILSNIMVHQAKEIAEYSLRVEQINAHVSLGEYDNIVQDTMRFQSSQAIIIFWEAYNFLDGLQYKINLLDIQQFEELIQKIKNEIDLVFYNLKHVPLLLINEFSTLIFEQYNFDNTRLEELVNNLNMYLRDKTSTSIKLIPIDKIISSISIQKAIDLRYFYSSKTLYSIDFYKEYFDFVKPIFLSVHGKSKKALIFDCDNTLWKGILGEDGFDKIKIYQEIQYLALSLAKKGVILGICSKNNSEDVDEVIQKHPDMILRNEHLIIKKVNWQDKATNLKLIAQDLNIGLDSIVFLDDSSFEVDLIKQKLPSICTLQVPSQEFEYAMLMRKIQNLFYNLTFTEEDLNKLTMYKNQIQRQQEKEEIGNIEDYLQSLNLHITVFIDDASCVDRIAQMTQKTNQFNLTTKRYTPNQILDFVNSDNWSVIAISVQDKFGDSGLTGLAIIEFNNNIARIDTFLMSCRILGRNIEYKFMDVIVEKITMNKYNDIQGQYIKTIKNHQVSDFFDKCGYNPINKNSVSHQYELQSDKYKSLEINYIKVSYEK